MTLSPFVERDAAHAHRVAALEHAHVVDREADALAARGRQQHVVLVRADLHVDDPLALVEPHGDLAGAVDLGEVGELVAPHRAARRGEHDVERFPGRLVLRQRHDGGDALARLERQQVDQRLAARLRRRERQPPDLLLVDLPGRGEEQHRLMGRGDEQPGDEILLARRHAGAALAAAPLRPIGRERRALDVAAVADQHDHVLALDEVLVVHVGVAVEDLGAARRGEVGLHLDELVADDAHQARARAQDVEIVGDLGRELVRAPRRSRRGRARSGARGAVRGWRAPALPTGGSSRRRRGRGADRRSARSAAPCRAPARRAPSAPRARRPSRARCG